MNSEMKGKMMFAPGCALILYKPELVEKVHRALNERLGEMDKLMVCCRHDPQLTEPTKVINICPGCDKRFGKDYENMSTISLWEVLMESDLFTLPDYHGQRMTILDACPTRENEKVHNAIRTILHKMNIELVEPKNTRTKSTCCGDSFYGVIPTEKVKDQMAKRAQEMPEEDVIVYCVSCINSMLIGGKEPHYLVDLLFGKETQPKIVDPDEWHKALDVYIDSH